jgi:hypothetical protein
VFAGAPESTNRAEPSLIASHAVVSPGYFATLGLAVRQGRLFSGDEPLHPRVAVISETMAARLWPHQSALGRTFHLDRPDSSPIDVVGVVSDARQGRAEGSSNVQFYVPFHHEPAPRMVVFARSDGAEQALLAGVRRAAMDVDRDLTLVNLARVQDQVDRSAAARRAPTVALASIGLVGLLLSTVGLYGVVSYVVRNRSAELGIRLALGAAPGDVGRLVLWQGLRLVTIGVAVGVGGALAVGYVVRSVVSGLSTPEPTVIVFVTGVLTCAALAALYFPVRYAMRVDPARVLRGD